MGNIIKRTPGTVEMTPYHSDARTAAYIQELFDDSDVHTIRMLPGTYVFKQSMYLHGTKNIIGYPGTVWTVDFDAENDGDYSGGGGAWCHLGCDSYQGNNDTWEGEINGIEFGYTNDTRVDRMFYLHCCKNVAFRNLKMDWSGAEDATLDAWHGFTFGFNINWNWHSEYPTVAENILFDNIFAHIPQNDVPGGEFVGVRGAHAKYYAQCPKPKGIVVRDCHILGLGDDPVAIHHCDDCMIHDNYTRSAQGRLLVNGTRHAIVSNNTCRPMQKRDGGWAHMNLIEAHHTDAIRPSSGLQGWQEIQCGTVIEGNTLEYPEDYDGAGSHSAIKICAPGTVAKGNTIVNHSVDEVQMISIHDREVNAQDSGTTGTHTGTTDLYVLTDSQADFWPGALVGFTVTNTDTGATGTITANTDTTITCSTGLTGGTRQDWQNGDAYSVPGDNRTVGQIYRQPTGVVIDGNVGYKEGSGEVNIYLLEPEQHATPLDWEYDIGEILFSNNVVPGHIDDVRGRLTFRGNKVGGCDITAHASVAEPIPVGAEEIRITSAGASYLVRLPRCLEGSAIIRGVVGNNGFKLRSYTGDGDKINGIDCSISGSYKYLTIPADSEFICRPVFDDSRTPLDACRANWIVQAWNTTNGAERTLAAPA